MSFSKAAYNYSTEQSNRWAMGKTGNLINYLVVMDKAQDQVHYLPITSAINKTCKFTITNAKHKNKHNQ